MKLTKGKIAKLYNKRKQTLKKKSKPKRSAGKSKTFRQNRKVNLSRQSLRRFSYSGGRLPVNVSNRVLSVADTGLSAAQQGLSNVDQVVSEVPPVGPVGEARLGLTAAEMGISGIQKGVEAAQTAVNPTDELPELPVVGTELPEPELPEPELPEPELPEPELPEPTVGSELPEPTVGSELPEQLAEPTSPIVVNTEVPEPAINTEVPETIVAPELPEPADMSSSEEQNSKLNDAVKTIVDEITKQVEENLTSRAAQQEDNVTQEDEVAPGETNGQDDGFKAFTGAVDKLTADAVSPESGGKRRRNTRRFKLVKNKTKRSTP